MFNGTTVALATVAVLTWYSVSVPGYYFLLLMFLFYGWLLVGGTWLVLTIMSIDTARSRALRSPWLIGGVALVLPTASALAWDWPLHVRFQLSRSALDGITAEMAAPDAPQMIERRSIGLFDAESLERFDGGYRFLVRDAGFIDPGGLAYSPNGEPPNIGGEDRYYPFNGPWWIWIESW